MLKLLKTLLKIMGRLFILIVIAAIAMGIISVVVVNEVKDHVYTVDRIRELPEADCVMAPGALVHPGGRMSLTLHDRVQVAVDVYKAGKAQKILLSGDHEHDDYDEVGAMLAYCKQQGVPDEDIFCDHYGLSTYESVIRARDVFGVKTIIISTQDFHITRAVYIAKHSGIEAYGVNASIHSTYGRKTDIWSPIREIPGRAKDFITTNITKPAPKYTGNR